MNRIQRIHLGRVPFVLTVSLSIVSVIAGSSLMSIPGFTQTTPHIVKTVAVGKGPWKLVVDSSTQRVFVLNALGNSVSVLDSRTGHLQRTLHTGPTPSALAIDHRTGLMFVVNTAASGVFPPEAPHLGPSRGTVSIFDAASGQMLRTIRVGQNPFDIGIDERTSRAFVANIGPTDRRGLLLGNGNVAILDTGSGDLIGTSEIGGDAYHVSVDESLGRVFVLGGGNIVVLDPWTGNLADILRPAFLRRGASMGIVVDHSVGHLVLVAFSAEGQHVAAGLFDTNSDSLFHVTPLTSYSPTSLAIDEKTHRVFVAIAHMDGSSDVVDMLDSRTGTLLRTVTIGPDGPFSTGIAVDGKTNHVFVTNMMGDIVSVLDATSGAVIRTLEVGQTPTAVAVDERSGHVFVANYASSTVTMLDG